MLGSIGRRYLTATRYALLGQAKNRMAIILLIAFVPMWYCIVSLFSTHRGEAWREATRPEQPLAFAFDPYARAAGALSLLVGGASDSQCSCLDGDTTHDHAVRRARGLRGLSRVEGDVNRRSQVR